MHTKPDPRRLAAVLAATVMLLVAAIPALAADEFTPSSVVVDLQAGQSTTIHKTLHLDALPGAADIIIAIDTTGSMGAAIAQAKLQATALCTDVQSVIPTATFAVFDFKDVPDRPAPLNGVLILTPVFTSSCAAVQAAINTMTASGGGDTPEAYNWVFNKAYSDVTLNASRNPAAVQFLVVLGDAPPHNTPAPATAPACGNTPPADVGITSDSEIAALLANDITLLMINYDGGPILTCYQQLTNDGGGTAVNAGSDLSAQIIAQIQAAAADIDEVQLVVSAGCPLGISFDPAPPYGPLTAPVTISFDETITAPTVPGPYTCTVTALVDGTPRATQTITATVTPGDPAHLDLQPPTATNTAGDQHCVTATVTDSFGNPVPNVVVNFSVTGANPAGGPATTGPTGVATFCYVGTVVGPDTITATAVGGSNPTDTASKTWEPGDPASLVLTPPTKTNFVDTQHCVTATVVDAFGNATPGIIVRFSVTGSVTTTGQATTNAAGVATFCYTGPGLPGADVITAFADTNGDSVQQANEPSGRAAKTWVIPLNNEACKVTYGGRITAANGDKATFGGNAQGKGPKGQEEYQDHGPAMDINVHSINVLAVTCSTDGTTASIFGKATVDGAGSFDYRIDVKDLAEPGSTDTYRIRLSGGYDSGVKVLSGGNIQIH